MLGRYAPSPPPNHLIQYSGATPPSRPPPEGGPGIELQPLILHERSLRVSYELHGSYYTDYRGIARATAHIVLMIFLILLKIPPSRKVSWHRAKCSLCSTRRVRVSGDAVGGREFHSAGSQMGSVGFTVPNIKPRTCRPAAHPDLRTPPVRTTLPPRISPHWRA